MRVFRKFTLIELLIVLATIMVLVAMLVPALKKVRDKSMEIGCVSNVRQMGVFFNLYTGDHDGYVPPSTGTVHKGGVDYIRYFVDYLSIYHSETKFHVAANSPVLWGIWYEDPWADMFTCGMAKETAEFRGVAEHNQYAYGSLGMNPAIGWHERQKGLAGQLQPQKTVNLNPDQILATEGNSAGININLYPNIYGLFPRHNNFEDLTVFYVGGHVDVEGPEIYDEGYSDWSKAPWSK